MSKRTNLSTCLRCLTLGSSMLACSSGKVDLGGGGVVQDVQRGSRCSASTIVAGDVSVANQDDLDALLGCEEIHGDLSVQVFEGTDLRPLRQLRVVDGWVHLGREFDLLRLTEAETATGLTQTERAQQIIEAGWLPSLEGVESLQRVGALDLLGLAAPDLRAFESLRIVGDKQLMITKAKNLIDLRGLEQVPDFTSLELDYNPSLESLQGLQMGSSLRQLVVQSAPRLADIGALSSVASVDSGLYLWDTGIPDLDALSHLNVVSGGVGLADNAQLTQVDALANLSYVSGGLVFDDNPKFERLPDFSNLQDIDVFRARGNAELVSISLNCLHRQVHNDPEINHQAVRSGVIEIGSNPRLETLAFEAGFKEEQLVYIHDNGGLTRLDLGSLRRLDRLMIDGNANLTDVSLGNLQTVDALSVTSNPRLDPSELRNVRSFDSEFSGNADDPAP